MHIIVTNHQTSHLSEAQWHYLTYIPDADSVKKGRYIIGGEIKIQVGEKIE
jgi:hypothetical protein